MRPFVVYWNNIPAPYMVERFNALAERGTLEFEAWFSDRIRSDRCWNVDEQNWRFPHRYLPTTHLFGRTFHWPLPLLGRRPDVLVSLYAEPSFLAGWGLAKLRGVKTGLWVEVTSDQWPWIVRTTTREWLKRWLFPKVDAIVTVGADGKQFAERYGAPAERIFFTPHAIDVLHYSNGAECYAPRREMLRDELGLRGVTFLYVGRLSLLKGVNHLLEAFETVQRQSAVPVSLLLVGGGVDEPELKLACAMRQLRNVVFIGFEQKPNLPRYYALADVFVFPTLGDTYGLVVDEAMACSLPVISTSAAGEIRDRIVDGINGYIVPPKDSAALAACMLALSDDSALRMRMGKVSAEKIRNHTPEQWAADFERTVLLMLGNQQGPDG